MTTMTGFSLSTIGQISVPVSDLQRARGFYRDVLGLPFLFEVPGMAFFDCDGVRLLLSTPEHAGDAKSDSSVLYFKVSDIKDAYIQLQAKGVAFRDKPHLIARMPDHELWMAFFHDTEKNLHALMAELPQSAG